MAQNINNQEDPLKKRLVPRGLEKLIEQCLKIYPDQTNPLQVTTVIKYWLGGQDPLDYISMYHNPGNPDLNIPPHWHYISFGLSDLHGDGRVHLPETTGVPETRSGMGFELTFRLIKTKDQQAEERPPTWPANLLQALAKYVFQSGNRLCSGDNIPWRRSLDSKASKIEHMLIADDAQMSRTETPFGWVDFLQIVGVTSEELEQASRWNGKGVLNLLKKDPSTGGPWLITDMTRSKSVFQLFPDTLRQLDIDLEKEGSDLAGVNAEFTFKELPKLQKIKTEQDDAEDEIAKSLSDWNIEVKQEFNNDCLGNSGSMNNFDMICPFESQPIPSRVNSLDGIELTLAPYAAKFLILAIKDRIRHGRHFTFKAQNLAVTFVAESVTGSIVNKQNPFGVLGYWIQILIPEDLISIMLDSFSDLNRSADNLKIPITYEWPERNLRFVIDNPPAELLNQQGPILA